VPPPPPQESPDPPGGPAAGPHQFATTRWTLVAAAGKTATPEARTALAELCRLYWYPLYAFVRRRGYDADEALDLTQGFFTRLIEKNDLADADPDRGRFRSWLLASVKHFLANEWDRATAQKRGGGRAVYSLDNGVPVSKKLAAELTNPQRLKRDLLLQPNEDGLFPVFTQTRRAER